MRASPLIRRKRVLEINTYMLPNESPVLSVRPCRAANEQNAPQRLRKRQTEEEKGDGQKVMMDASEPLDASEASVRD
jgi:hypothetical protein